MSLFMGTALNRWTGRRWSVAMQGLWTVAAMATALAMLTMMLAAPAHADAELDKVVSCMRGNVPPTLRIEDVQLTSYDRIGTEKKMSGKIYAMREDGYLRAMLRLLTPQDLSGSAYLLVERADRDDMFAYLPAAGRVRRINSSQADSSIMGTSFSYMDIKQVQSIVSGGDLVRLPDEKLGDVAVYRLTMKMPATSNSEYTRADAWVDQQSCVVLKAEMLAGTNVRKRLESTPSSIKKSGSYAYVSSVTVTDLQTNTSTRLEVTGVTGGDALASRYFDPNRFYLGN